MNRPCARGNRFGEKSILAIDGHDGAGKSSVASVVAQAMGGTVIKPFRDSLGDMIAWLWGREQFALANQLALQAVQKCVEESRGKRPLVFDRHWLTMFTVLPESFYHVWHPLPQTVLCWSNLETTLARLRQRGEEIGDIGKHRYYLSRYRELAVRFGVRAIDTSTNSVDETAARVLEMMA